MISRKNIISIEIVIGTDDFSILMVTSIKKLDKLNFLIKVIIYRYDFTAF